MFPPCSAAILLFTRSAGEEAVRKRLVSHGRRVASAAVAAQLIRHAKTTAQSAGVSFLCVDSAHQKGSSFGARLVDAMQRAFAQGYEQLIVIGNDCPQLGPALLRRAVAALATHGAVLGPAADGGVYLLGVSRAHFQAQAWAGLPWQQATLGAALARQLRAAGAPAYLLPRLADVDNEQDLARVLRQPLLLRLRRALRRLRGTAAFPRRAVAVPAAWAFAPARPHRGPPQG